MSGSFSRCDGQLASFNELYDVGVVSVRRVKRHEARHAVDVAADACVDAVEGCVLCVAIHDQSSADAVQLPTVYAAPAVYPGPPVQFHPATLVLSPPDEPMLAPLLENAIVGAVLLATTNVDEAAR